MYSDNFIADNTSLAGQLLVKARDDYKVNLAPITVQHFGLSATWADSFTKLLAVNQTQYRRVLSLDSDGTVLQVGLQA
jgi:alpha-N-acetylglucosamine transferase